MDPRQLTAEQVKDIEERVASAKKSLEELQLKPVASVQSVNVGDDVFSQKVIVYLQDLKFTSPVQQKDL